MGLYVIKQRGRQTDSQSEPSPSPNELLPLSPSEKRHFDERRTDEREREKGAAERQIYTRPRVGSSERERDATANLEELFILSSDRFSIVLQALPTYRD